MDCYLCGHLNDPESIECELCRSTLLAVAGLDDAPAASAVPAPDPLAQDPFVSGIEPDPAVPTPPPPPADPLAPEPPPHTAPAPTEALTTMAFGEAPNQPSDLQRDIDDMRAKVKLKDDPIIVVPRFAELGDTSKRILLAACVAALAFGGYAIYSMVGGDDEPQPDLAFTEPTTTIAPVVATDDDLAEFAAAVYRLDVTTCGVTTSAAAFAIDDQHLLTTASAVLDAQPQVQAPDGTLIPTTVVGVSDSPDLAVLSVAEPLPTHIAPGSGFGVAAAQEIIVVPPGVDGGSVIAASVSEFRSGWLGPQHGFVLDTALDATLSGAPAFDRTGQLVGLATWLSSGPYAGSMVVVTIDQLLDAATVLTDRGSAPGNCGRAGLPAAPVDTWGDPTFGSEDRALGSDPVLDDVADRCIAADWGACDDLTMAVWNSGSDYWAHGLTCGGTEAASARFCIQRKGSGVFNPQESHEVGDCLILPRNNAGSFRNAPCDALHDAEVYFVGTFDGDLDYLAAVQATTTVAPTTTLTPPEPGQPIQLPTLAPASVSNRAIIDPTVVSTASATIERRCNDVFGQFVDAQHWDAPFQFGVILPDGDTRPHQYACFVHRPGAVLHEGYFG